MWINDYALMESNILSPSFKYYGNINIFFEAVCNVRYPFFVWNGLVKKVLDNQEGWECTGIMIEEVRKNGQNI